jgi:hypothetical protein
MANELDETEELKALLAQYPQFLPKYLQDRANAENKSIREGLHPAQITTFENTLDVNFEKAFNKAFDNPEGPKRDQIANKLGNMLLKACVQGQTLEGNIQKERAGFDPNVEAMLRTVLRMKGLNIHPDLLFGNNPPIELLQALDRQGKVPESEDNIRDFLARLGITPPGEEINRDTLEETFKENFQAPSPTLKK